MCLAAAAAHNCRLLINFLDRTNVGFAVLTINRELGFTPSVYGLAAGIFFVSYSIFSDPGESDAAQDRRTPLGFSSFWWHGERRRGPLQRLRKLQTCIVLPEIRCCKLRRAVKSPTSQPRGCPTRSCCRYSLDCFPRSLLRGAAHSAIREGYRDDRFGAHSTAY